jgi:UDPglucose 6-dehydrogenase
MDPVSAEVTKYACNAFLATRISFMNELARLCEKVGGDVEEVRRGMSSDVRIGRHFLYAGVGYGGSCFPKDVQALMATGRAHGLPMEVVTAAENANARQKKHMGAKVLGHFGKDIAGKTIAIWGLAFKPNTDDMREAPALTIIADLIDAGARIKAYDPVATHAAREVLGNQVEYCTSAFGAVQGADALVLVTEWNEFRHIDLDHLKQSLKQPVVFDGRNVFNPAQMFDRGFTYFGIGRG